MEVDTRFLGNKFPGSDMLQLYPAHVVPCLYKLMKDGWRRVTVVLLPSLVTLHPSLSTYLPRNTDPCPSLHAFRISQIYFPQVMRHLAVAARNIRPPAATCSARSTGFAAVIRKAL